jgi:uncharacterized protein DUF1572
MQNKQLMNNYLSFIKTQFEYYKSLGEGAFNQLADDELFWQYNPESNSMATMVKHLWGNMLSRWTDFLTSDGEKEWRNREAEFDNDIQSRQKMMQKWEEGWACLFAAMKTLTDKDLDKTVLIRNEKHTIVEAINRQIAHYAYHVGQMVYLAKMISGSKWESLSIPRGESEVFNKDKFGKS